MSNSDHMLLVKENQEEIEFNVLLQKPKFQFHDGISFQENIGKCKQVLGREQKQEQEEEESKNTNSCTPELLEEELKASNNVDDDDDEDDNDGFKTPTSLDHKIPLTKQCPPAPTKPSKSSLSSKRKSSNVRASRQLDLSQEVECLFPKPILDDFHRKIKKARRDHDD
ncbi:hypothetical protein JCGZ_09065 [Jatropha curcas]|uniref:Cyclin-dependent protein kinase inhibitor SMR3 n=1 Tax=Jatropha curcas TaxID=180498 RepID=A0A067KHL7_JATCU|nr:hypothetical protein JCGZ_09065 [Jatropha curcas]